MCLLVLQSAEAQLELRTNFQDCSGGLFVHHSVGLLRKEQLYPPEHERGV